MDVLNTFGWLLYIKYSSVRISYGHVSDSFPGNVLAIIRHSFGLFCPVTDFTAF
jgi:hypothetical protein